MYARIMPVIYTVTAFVHVHVFVWLCWNIPSKTNVRKMWKKCQEVFAYIQKNPLKQGMSPF